MFLVGRAGCTDSEKLDGSRLLEKDVGQLIKT
jgi:hypothetical protein